MKFKLLILMTVLMVSCGKDGIKLGKTKKKVEKSKTVVARNNDTLVVEANPELTPGDQTALEGQVNGPGVDDLPLPDGEGGSESNGSTGVEIEAGATVDGGYSGGDQADGLTVGGSASLVIDIIDNDKDELLWTIPINGSIQGIRQNGGLKLNKIDFDVNVQRILSPYFSASGEFLGSWNYNSALQRRLYGGAGLNLDIFGNMNRPGRNSQLLTSFYLMAGQDQLSDGQEAGKGRASFRLELRDIYLTNKDTRDNFDARLFGKLDTNFNLTNWSDNYVSAEAGVSILSPEFLGGMRVGVTPSYQYTRIDTASSMPVEHQHTFNLGFSLEGPRFGINRN